MFTIKSTKWYGRFWPAERKKIKIMQAIANYYAPDIEKEVSRAWSDHLIYGKPMPTEAEWKRRLTKVTSEHKTAKPRASTKKPKDKS